MTNQTVLEEDVRLAKAFGPLDQSQMKALAAQLSATHEAGAGRLTRDYVDA